MYMLIGGFKNSTLHLGAAYIFHMYIMLFALTMLSINLLSMGIIVWLNSKRLWYYGWQAKPPPHMGQSTAWLSRCLWFLTVSAPAVHLLRRICRLHCPPDPWKQRVATKCLHACHTCMRYNCCWYLVLKRAPNAQAMQPAEIGAAHARKAFHTWHMPWVAQAYNTEFDAKVTRHLTFQYSPLDTLHAAASRLCPLTYDRGDKLRLEMKTAYLRHQIGQLTLWIACHPLPCIQAGTWVA